MKLLPIGLFAIVTLLLTGCAGTRAAFHDMSPTPTASISDGWLTLHLGADQKGPIYSVRPTARFEGGKVFLNGSHSQQLVSREIAIPLAVPAGDISEVFWIEPDGSTVVVPLSNPGSAPVTVSSN